MLYAKIVPSNVCYNLQSEAMVPNSHKTYFNKFSNNDPVWIREYVWQSFNEVEQWEILLPKCTCQDKQDILPLDCVLQFEYMG